MHGRRLLIAVLLTASGLGASATSAQAGQSIVGGRDVTAGEVPYQVALVYAGSGPAAGQFCGGTILDPTHIATAAHCVTEEDGSQTLPASIYVQAGIVDLPQLPTDAGETRQIGSVVRMPSYDAVVQSDDAAVLTLTAPLAYSAAVQPMSLGAARATGGTLRVSGWGDTTEHDADMDGVMPTYASRMKLNDVGLVADSACDARYGSSLVPDEMVCAGGPGQDTCQGDSGGPAVQDGKLVGITSFGLGCGSSDDYPGVYTEVADPPILRFLAGAAGLPVPTAPPAPATPPAPAPAPVTPAPVVPPVVAAAPVAPPAVVGTPKVIATASGRVDSRGRIAVRVRSTVATTAIIVLLDASGRSRSIGSAHVSLAAGQTRTVRVTLPRSTRRALRRHTIPVRLVTTIGTTSTTVALRLKRR